MQSKIRINEQINPKSMRTVQMSFIEKSFTGYKIKMGTARIKSVPRMIARFIELSISSVTVSWLKKILFWL